MSERKWVFVLKIFMEQLQIVSESPLSYYTKILRIDDATQAQNFQFRYLKNGCNFTKTNEKKWMRKKKSQKKSAISPF